MKKEWQEVSNYESKKPKTYITYFDMNNLYGHTRSQYWPYANFNWVRNINEIEQKLMKIKSNSSTGYILEVDLEYPQKLHNKQSDFSLAPEKINIQIEWLSDYYLEIVTEHNITTGTAKKLVTNLMDKNNYIIYYRNLQQSLELGMKLKKNAQKTKI